MSIFVIGDRDTVLGLALAGIAGRVAGDRGQAERALDAALARDEIELLCITRELSAQMRERVEELQRTSLRPVVLEIPGRDARPAERSLGDTVRRAVGIHV